MHMYYVGLVRSKQNCSYSHTYMYEEAVHAVYSLSF